MFIPNHDHNHRIHAVIFNELKPFAQSGEALSIRFVIYYNHRGSRFNGDPCERPVLLLAGGVPNLKSDNILSDLPILVDVVNSNRGRRLLIKHLSVPEPLQQTRLPDAGLPEQHQLDQVLISAT